MKFELNAPIAAAKIVAQAHAIGGACHDDGMPAAAAVATVTAGAAAATIVAAAAAAAATATATVAAASAVMAKPPAPPPLSPRFNIGGWYQNCHVVLLPPRVLRL